MRPLHLTTATPKLAPPTAPATNKTSQAIPTHPANRPHPAAKKMPVPSEPATLNKTKELLKSTNPFRGLTNPGRHPAGPADRAQKPGPGNPRHPRRSTIKRCSTPPGSPSNPRPRHSPTHRLPATLTQPPTGDSVKPSMPRVPSSGRPVPTAIATSIGIAAILILASRILATPALADDTVLPDGKGREQVENACTVCHTADRITKQSLTVDQWRSELRTMIENGASLNPDEWEPVVAYLVRNFGPKINVNTATARQLADDLQLTPAEANAIVAWRQANGAYKDFNDLTKVPGLDTKKIQGNKIVF